MALTVEQAIEAVCRAAGELEWEPRHSDDGTADFDREGNSVDEPVTKTCFEFNNWTSDGQNFTAIAFMYGADIGSLLDSLDGEADGFDADWETKYYIRGNLIGYNGTPCTIRGLLDSMEERGEMLLNFANQMRQKLEHLTEDEDDEGM